MLNDCNFCNFLILIRKFSRSHCPSGRDKICNSFRIAVKERPKQLQRFCNTKSEVKRVGTLGWETILIYFTSFYSFLTYIITVKVTNLKWISQELHVIGVKHRATHPYVSDIVPAVTADGSRS